MSNTTSKADKLRTLLEEYMGRSLDGDLSKRIEEICLGLEEGSIEGYDDTAEAVKGYASEKIVKDYEERRVRKRRIRDKIIDVLGIGLCLLDKDLKITWANQTLCDWLDLEETPVGKSCHDLYHCNRIGDGICPATGVFEGGAGGIIETWIESEKMKKMCVQHVAIPIKNGNDNVNSVLILTIDSTESEMTVHRLLLLQKLSEVMQGTLHLDKLLHLILTCVTSGYAFGFNRAMLFLINKEHNVMNGKLAVGPSSHEEALRIWNELSGKYDSLNDIFEELDFSHNIDTQFNTMTRLMVYPLTDTREVVVSCAIEKKPVIVKDAVNDKRVTDEFIKSMGVNEFVCVPLIRKDESIGVLVADNIYTKEPITKGHINILTTFANHAALAIENAETYKKLENKVNQLTDAQQRLILSEKMATIGAMSSYIAHEIRNPLVTIGGFAKNLSRYDFNDQKITTKIKIIMEEVKRLEKILNNITDFAKPVKTEKVAADICEIVDDTCILMESYFHEKHIKLHKHFETQLPQIYVDPAQIKQVFLNILMNAVEAMPDGGEIEINMKSSEELVNIDIVNSGDAIPENILQNIFDPFFTTKPSGTGVGLSVSLKIIEDHGGKIAAKSKDGEGTTMSVTLPVQ